MWLVSNLQTRNQFQKKSGHSLQRSPSQLQLHTLSRNYEIERDFFFLEQNLVIKIKVTLQNWQCTHAKILQIFNLVIQMFLRQFWYHRSHLLPLLNRVSILSHFTMKNFIILKYKYLIITNFWKFCIINHFSYEITKPQKVITFGWKKIHQQSFQFLFYFIVLMMIQYKSVNKP